MRRRSARPGRACSCGLVALTLAIVVPAAAQAAGTTTFSVRPGHYDQADPATRAYFKRVVAPGGSFADDVVVTNGAGVPLTLRVYPVDGLTGQTSGAVYANRAQPRRKAGAWVRSDVSRLVVPAHGLATVQFAAHVPQGAVPGDHLAGIAFEDAHVVTSGGSFRVREVLREVIGVLIRVPGPAQARLRLGSMSLHTIPGTHLGSVVIGIADVGRLLCKPTLSVRLASSGRRQVITRRLDTILPGDKIAYPLILRHALQPSTYVVHAATSCASSTARKSARVVLGARLSGSADSARLPAAVVAAAGHSSPIPWTFVFIELTVLAAAAAGLTIVLRRRRSHP